MANIKYYLVTFDRLDRRVIYKLSKEEKKSIICYAVNSAIPKLITPEIKIVEEWKLKWYTPRYQFLQYYEYGAIVHCIKNPELLEGLTHVGLLHYDVFFPENSINEIKENLNKNPDIILYNTLRHNDTLYFTNGGCPSRSSINISDYYFKEYRNKVSDHLPVGIMIQNDKDDD